MISSIHYTNLFHINSPTLASRADSVNDTVIHRHEDVSKYKKDV